MCVLWYNGFKEVSVNTHIEVLQGFLKFVLEQRISVWECKISCRFAPLFVEMITDS